MMGKGFLSFVLGSVFLLALVSSGSLISSQAPDRSYEKYRGTLVLDVAIKQSYYLAISDAASIALRDSLASGGEPGQRVRSAMLIRTLEFQSSLKEEGFDAVFWCGPVSEKMRAEASEGMTIQKMAVIPQGALPISACAGSFEAALLEKKAHFYDMGFSFYSPEYAIGRAAALPPSYEVLFQ